MLFRSGAFSMGSGATEPGVPGMTEPARDVVPPSFRAFRFRIRSSSNSRSYFACSRKAVTISFLNVTVCVGVLAPSDTEVGILFAEEGAPERN